MLKQWLSFAFMGIFTVLPLIGSAETHGQALERMCQNGDKLKELDRRISEADAMQDSIRYQLHYDEAREYFRCSKTLTDPYSADVATLLYAAELDNSARTNGEEDNRGHVAASAANELAASTRFDDIRKQAISLRDMVRKEADVSHNAIYGAPESSPSPTFVPTDTPTP